MGRMALLDVLAEARDRGFLGPGDLEPQVAHALVFAAAVAEPDAAVDLGSGGGLPALVLAEHWPGSRWVLVEAMHKRAAFLREAVAGLGLAARVEVVHERAEIVGRAPERRARAGLVTARGFGAPAVVAEAAAPLLRVGGVLVVSEPPDLGDSWARWPVNGLIRAGLVPERVVRAGSAVRVLRQVAPCGADLPRPNKQQRRAPLW